MNPGDTFFGLDERGHLWLVLSTATVGGDVAVANLTTHGRERRNCDERCLLIRSVEHPYVAHDSCVFWRGAFLTSIEWLRRGVDNRSYRTSTPLGPELLERIRRDAIAARLTPPDLRDAIQEDLRRQ